MNKIKLSCLFFILNIFWLNAYANIFSSASNNKLIGFGFNVTQELTSQGMIYSPLKKDKLYAIKCSIKESNTNKKIKITVHFDGESSKQHLWGKNSKYIETTLDGSTTNAAISFEKIKPIKLNEKWIKKLGIVTTENNQEFYIINLTVDPLAKFSDSEMINGICDITPLV